MDWKTRAQRAGALAVATGGFLGFFPIAPGTVGSLAAALFLWGVPGIPLWAHLLLTVVLLLVGVWSCNKACQILKKADAQPIVIDEIVGILISMVGIPLTEYWLVCGFILFRIFDVIKLPPANYFDEKVKNGWGVMLDDVTAGVFANVFLRLMLRAQF
jgi:phosphatidylglycerophosphatase A